MRQVDNSVNAEHQRQTCSRNGEVHPIGDAVDDLLCEDSPTRHVRPPRAMPTLSEGKSTSFRPHPPRRFKETPRYSRERRPISGQVLAAASPLALTGMPHPSCLGQLVAVDPWTIENVLMVLETGVDRLVVFEG